MRTAQAVAASLEVFRLEGVEKKDQPHIILFPVSTLWLVCIFVYRLVGCFFMCVCVCLGVCINVYGLVAGAD